jgi:hypothetical protein
MYVVCTYVTNSFYLYAISAMEEHGKCTVKPVCISAFHGYKQTIKYLYVYIYMYIPYIKVYFTANNALSLFLCNVHKQYTAFSTFTSPLT